MLREHTILLDMSRSGVRGPLDFGPTLERVWGTPPEPNIETESLTPSDIRDLSRDPKVVGIAPTMPTKLITPFEAVTTKTQAISWGISAIRADVSPFAGTGVVVSVLDTGIDATHPAFQGVNIQQEDFSGGGNGDHNGHGTHCAGTIFGRDVNGIRIGVARGVTKALIGKVLDDNGGGSSEMIFRAIQWALEEGAHVISMSLGFDFPGLVSKMQKQGWPVELATSVALEAYGGNLRVFDALMGMIRARTAFGSQVVVIAAAGNESQRDQDPDFEIAAGLPAAADGVISVGALAQSANGFKVAPFSNTLPQISAPGVNIVSTQARGGLQSLSGTSMACPHVAGVAALWWQAIRQSQLPATARSVVAKLLATARTNVFADVEVADRGVGLATAPTEPL